MNGIGNQFDLGSIFLQGRKAFDNNVFSDMTSEKAKPQYGEQVYKLPNSAIGMKLVYRTLASRFQGFAQQTLKAPENTEQTKSADNEHIFDFNEVAKNVLEFVSSTLKGAKSNGASDEKIANLFKQARQGVEQGFSDAQEELSDINKLDGEVSEGIGKSRDLIDQGINQLEKQLRPDAFVGSSGGAAATVPTQSSPNGDTSRVAQLSTSIDYQSYAAKSLENTSDLSITTADGDVVTISFSDYAQNSNSQQLSYANNSNGEQFGFLSSQSSYRETNFSFSVDGNLDEGEKKAIGDLIKEISKIEKSFFNGNIDKAFKQALKLGYDSSELSGFQLDLTQTKMAVVSQKYTEVAQLDNQPNNNAIANTIKPVKDFVAQYNQLNDLTNTLFSDQQQPFQQLLDSVFNAQFSQQQDMLARLQDFTSLLNEQKK